MSTLDQKLVSALGAYPDIRLAILFGSNARGTARFDSDLDVGVAARQPLPAELRMRLIGDFAELAGRPVDLVDLQAAGIPILTQVLTTGRLILCADTSVYAELMKRVVFEQADFMPLRARLLEERRRSWIGH